MELVVRGLLRIRLAVILEVDDRAIALEIALGRRRVRDEIGHERRVVSLLRLSDEHLHLGQSGEYA